jgi:hypothetical protein
MLTCGCAIAAVNPCVNDYYIGFQGLNVQIPIPLPFDNQVVVGIGISFIGYSENANIVTSTSVSSSTQLQACASRAFLLLVERVIDVDSAVHLQGKPVGPHRHFIRPARVIGAILATLTCGCVWKREP